MKIPQPRKVWVLVFDESGISVIQREPVGKPWMLNGNYVYCAKPKGEGQKELIPFDPLAKWRAERKSREMVNTPEDLYDSIEWPEVAAVYKLGGNLMQKINLGLMVMLVGILLFFVYVVFSSMTGG
ncbi:hypothetical protein ES703_44517 [subsurface metagenome]